MTKLDTLLLLQELFKNAVVSETAPDDPSGISTVYLVDQEQLMRNLETAIEETDA